MKIIDISSDQKEVTTKLSEDDLRFICNALGSQLAEKKGEDNFLQLFNDMRISLAALLY